MVADQHKASDNDLVPFKVFNNYDLQYQEVNRRGFESKIYVIYRVIIFSFLWCEPTASNILFLILETLVWK